MEATWIHEGVRLSRTLLARSVTTLAGLVVWVALIAVLGTLGSFIGRWVSVLPSSSFGTTGEWVAGAAATAAVLGYRVQLNQYRKEQADRTTDQALAAIAELSHTALTFRPFDRSDYEYIANQFPPVSQQLRDTARALAGIRGTADAQRLMRNCAAQLDDLYLRDAPHFWPPAPYGERGRLSEDISELARHLERVLTGVPTDWVSTEFSTRIDRLAADGTTQKLRKHGHDRDLRAVRELSRGGDQKAALQQLRAIVNRLSRVDQGLASEALLAVENALKKQADDNTFDTALTESAYSKAEALVERVKSFSFDEVSPYDHLAESESAAAPDGSGVSPDLS